MIVDVRAASRKLTDKEHERLVIMLHAGAVGSWDWDNHLANWDAEELQEWGMDQNTLTEWNSDGANLSMMLGAEQDTEIPDFPEYDESIADDVEMTECPSCGHRFPK